MSQTVMIRIEKSTHERLAKLSKESGVYISTIASAILESGIDKMYEEGEVRIEVSIGKEEDVSKTE